MAKMAEWYKELKTELEKTVEYKIESTTFKIAIQVYNRLKELGITQKELAERLNVSKSYVSQILKGKTNMTIETMIKLSDVLDLTTEINFIPKVESPVFIFPYKEKPIFEKIDFSNYFKSMTNVTGSAVSVVSQPLGYDTAGNENIKTVAG